MDHGDAKVADRLDAFARRLERLQVDLLPAFALSADDRSLQAARRAAARIAHDRGLEETIESARAWITDWTLRVYGSWQYQPTFIGLNWGRSMGRPEDRARVAETLSDAVVAVSLGDLLDPGDAATLLGGWAGLLEADGDAAGSAPGGMR
jgi:hypothetical protein